MDDALPTRRIALGGAIGALGVLMLVFRPEALCPPNGVSASCNAVSAYVLCGVGLLIAGAAVALLAIDRWRASRLADSWEEGTTSDTAAPLVDPGTTYLYQRRPPR